MPGVTDVHCPAANNGTTLMIQLNQTYRGQAKQAAAAIWGSNAAHLRYKNVWVLDDDIDMELCVSRLGIRLSCERGGRRYCFHRALSDLCWIRQRDCVIAIR